MKRLTILSLSLVLFNGCIAGCVTTQLDTELMNVRSQAAANEKLYGVATMKFADAFQQIAGQKHEFQTYLIEVEGDKWIEEHTKDGIVQATPDEFTAMLEKRDTRLKTLDSSQIASAQVVGDFRKMISDKMAFSAVIYGKEMDAQKAKESFAASVDSMVKSLAGFAASAAVFIPLAF